MNNPEWDLLLSKFRKLGGIADNVCQKDGENGRGIFPIDSTLKSRIFTPSNIMVKKKDLSLINDKIRINKEGNYNQEVKDFFYYYQEIELLSYYIFIIR